MYKEHHTCGSVCNFNDVDAAVVLADAYRPRPSVEKHIIELLVGAQSSNSPCILAQGMYVAFIADCASHSSEMFYSYVPPQGRGRKELHHI